MSRNTAKNEAVTTCINTSEVTPERFENLLRPFWAEEYRKLPGTPGVPGRFIQFKETRRRAVQRLENETGIRQPEDRDLGFFSFLKMYERGELPIK